MFCVKPKDLSGVLRNVSGSVKDDQLIVSIAAGVQLNKIEKVEFMNFQIVNFCFC
jgi:pyrroline-5-carboxylate reductase